MTSYRSLYTPKTTARLLGVGVSAVINRITAGKLETVEIDGVRFVTYGAIVKWRKSRERQARKLLHGGST